MEMQNAITNSGTAVALFEPEIPFNAGNAGRLCLGAGSPLYIVGKPGFLMTAKEIRRSGLDYWKNVNLTHFKTFNDFADFADGENRRVILVTKFASVPYYEYEYSDSDILLYGRESVGLPDFIRARYPDAVGIPMSNAIRSHNLSNSVTIVLYEAVRQRLTRAQ